MFQFLYQMHLLKDKHHILQHNKDVYRAVTIHNGNADKCVVLENSDSFPEVLRSEASKRVVTGIRLDNKQRKPLIANEGRERRRTEGIIGMSQQKERCKQCTNTQGKEPL